MDDDDDQIRSSPFETCENNNTAEHAKVGVRSARKEANAELKKIELSEDELKNAEVDVQEATDKFIALIDDRYQIKEKEIMTV